MPHHVLSVACVNSFTLHSNLQGKDDYYSHFIDEEMQAPRSTLSKVKCPVMSLGVKLSLTPYLIQAQRRWSLGAGQLNPEKAGKRVACVLSVHPLNQRQIVWASDSWDHGEPAWQARLDPVPPFWAS